MSRGIGSILLVAALAGGCGPDPVMARRPVPGSVARTDAAASQPDGTAAPSLDGAVASPPDGGKVVMLRDAGAGDAGRAADATAPATDAGRESAVDAGREASVDAGPADGDGGAFTDGADGAGNVAPSAVDAASDARSPRAGELVIDEILANPTGQDLGREWIEIANRGSERLDLSGLHVADATTDVAVAAGTIEPGGLLVLGQSLDASKNGGAPVGAAYGTHLILNNDAETVSICLGACATGVLLDQVGWEAIGAGYDGRALVVDPATKRLCPASDPFGTAGDFGTPGEPNPPCDASDAGTDSEADSLQLPHDPHG